MNILAEKQKSIYEDCISDNERVKRENEFNELYFKTKSKAENSFLGKLSLKTRKKLHRIVWCIFLVRNFLSGFRCEVINDDREKTEKPIIFAPTHLGKFDIEVMAVPIKDHFYLLSGDFEHLQGLIDGAFLLVNGVFYFNEKVKSDRIAVTEKMIKHLKQGGNLMYFPEGAWNLNSNLPVLPCYWGIVDVAKKSNALIVPIAIEQWGKRFKVNIGKNFDMQKYSDDITGKSQAITDLRNEMASLKWAIWESEPLQNRNLLKGNEWDFFVQERLAEWPYFDLDYIDGLIYKPKNITTYEDVFEHLKELKPNKNNAFLFDKRLK